jgi:hypothetical protein
MPLFAPLLANREFRIFDPATFAKSVEDHYDIPMSSLVAEGLIPQLAKAGLLTSDAAHSHVYRVAKFENSALYQSDDAAFEQMLDEFVEFSQPSLSRAQLSISATELKSGLLKRMTDLNFLTFLSQPDKNYFKGRTISLSAGDGGAERTPDPQQAIDVLSAGFAFHLAEAEGAKFELLSRLVKGALVAEVVLTLQTPSADADLKGVTVLFDGPILLDFFDLSTKELKEYSDALFDLVRKAKLKQAAFVHTLEEMEGTIRAPLDAIQRGEQPYGPLGTRIRQDSNHLAYARTMLGDLPQALQRHNVAIVDAKRYEVAERKRHCPEAVEDSLRNEFGLNQE